MNKALHIGIFWFGGVAFMLSAMGVGSLAIDGRYGTMLYGVVNLWLCWWLMGRMINHLNDIHLEASGRKYRHDYPDSRIYSYEKAA